MSRERIIIEFLQQRLAVERAAADRARELHQLDLKAAKAKEKQLAELALSLCKPGHQPSEHQREHIREMLKGLGYTHDEE